MDSKENNKRFSFIRRIKSANFALRGIIIFLKTTHNAWLHLFFGVLAVYMGFLLRISTVEWALVVLAIGLVLLSEAFNTAIEIDIDWTSPEYHPYARDTKDVAAGAVLLASIISGVIGLLIFLPKVLNMLE